MKSQKLKVLLGVLAMFAALQFSYGQGARYTGTYTKSAPIKYSGKSNFTIEGVEISGAGDVLIGLYNCENVTIRNSKLVSSPLKAGIYLFNCKNVTIVDCTFENVRSGLVASTSQGVKFEYNDVTNVIGVLHGSADFGSMVQFIQVSGAGNSISYNACENFTGASAPEDLVNIYASSGTSASPILIKGNWIRGGGPSNSGGGINLGDYGGAYQVAEDNVLVDAGQYGIAISGGNNMTLRNNKVYGKKQSFTNVGMIVTNWYEKEAGASFNITSSNNSINFTHAGGYQNSWWIPDNKGIVSGKETNKHDSSLSASILPDKIIGRARDSASEPAPEIPGDGNVTPNPDEGSGPSTSPENGGVNSPISIYVDNFNRICVNCQGRVYRSANVSVANSSGKKIYTQPLTGYHTVIRSRLNSGTYSVTVRNGNTTQTQQVTVK